MRGDGSTSVMLPLWSPEGNLLYIHDKTNWWNLYRHDNGTETNLCPMSTEIGGPAWVFGQSPFSCDPKGSGDILVAYDEVNIGFLFFLLRRQDSAFNVSCILFHKI